MRVLGADDVDALRHRWAGPAERWFPVVWTAIVFVLFYGLALLRM